MARRLCTNLKFRRGEINFLLTTNRAIQKLHACFLKTDKPTDVMTFCNGSIDIVISLDQAARQARLRRLRLIDEVTLLICHGLLHAKGFDDHTEKERLAMRQAEFESLARTL